MYYVIIKIVLDCIWENPNNAFMINDWNIRLCLVKPLFHRDYICVSWKLYMIGQIFITNGCSSLHYWGVIWKGKIMKPNQVFTTFMLAYLCFTNNDWNIRLCLVKPLFHRDYICDSWKFYKLGQIFITMAVQIYANEESYKREK